MSDLRGGAVGGIIREGAFATFVSGILGEYTGGPLVRVVSVILREGTGAALD